ncbi:DoxX family protein [Gilvimarinus agarilyticus]|uniref:HvfX family Cu-binding RiPP maturation protein n=1 Tax=unclassified Gilvimarinus TaxID=2642066 RepID=UPI001C09295B|nr:MULTISPECIES: DoxX family protein [unclassified Gilvimarinus]MBU2885976.1 DoxX family protein [Gilvimarinus agarilyticus]MDO6570722.1 DoxX family protein [Gilvimarinus sp. 2_MG-2023]MDO6747685.1 DoxX family protein [Gilvimarinus sp. 1_MG-2023]
MDTLLRWRSQTLNALTQMDSLAALALRLYLVPIFWMAGTQKLAHFSDTVIWFGNAEWGLGLPLPGLMAFLATATELIGAILLALGLFTRAITIPLMVTMLVAIFAVHWDYGWQAIADAGAPFANERVLAATEKLDRAQSLLREHGHYPWLTSSGKFVVLNNGIEFAATYLIMLLALLVWGPGRYFSLDDHLIRALTKRARAHNKSVS